MILAVLLLFCACSAGFVAVFFRVFFGRSERAGDCLELRYEHISCTDYPRSAVFFDCEGNTLRGWCYHAASSVGLVLIAHGFHGGADSHLAETMYFVDHGWTVLTFDGTGSRESGGSGTVSLSQMRADVSAALAFVRGDAQLSRLPVVIYGHSMGGYAAACAADDGVAAVASICGFNDPIELMQRIAGNTLGALATLAAPFLSMQNRLSCGADANEEAASVLCASQTPALIVQGADDEVLPYGVTIADCRAAIGNPNVTYFTVTEPFRAGHSTSWLSRDAVQYRLAVDTHLKAQKNACGGKLTQAQWEDFYRKIDFARMYRLDKTFMDTIHAFFLSAVQP